MFRRFVTTIPSTDRAFERAVQKVLEGTDNPTPDQIEAGLRPLFPRVAVFERVLSGEREHVYAYRDGRYQQRDARRWWDESNVACVCVDTSTGQLTHVSKAWAELMHTEPEGVVGRHFTDFVLPEARQAAQGMFEAVMDGGEIDTEALLVRPDGSTVTIQIHASRVKDEIDIRYRLTTL